MVTRIRSLLSIIIATAYAQATFADVALEPEPLIDRLDHMTRAKVILALTGLVMLGVLMMGMTWLAFRMLRSRFRQTDDVIQRQKNGNRKDEWARKPLSDHDTNQA